MGGIFSTAAPPATAMATKFVNDAIAKDKVVIFSKTHCPYCTMAKEVRARPEYGDGWQSIVEN